MCIKIMETQGTINQEEFNFFSFGAGMVDRTQQRPNNADWMPPVVWDNLTEMDKIPGFQVNNFFDLVPLLSHLHLNLSTRSTSHTSTSFIFPHPNVLSSILHYYSPLTSP